MRLWADAQQREVSYGTTARFLELFGLGSLEALGVVNSVDDCHKHGFTVRSWRGGRLPPKREAFVPDCCLVRSERTGR